MTEEHDQIVKLHELLEKYLVIAAHLEDELIAIRNEWARLRKVGIYGINCLEDAAEAAEMDRLVFREETDDYG